MIPEIGHFAIIIAMVIAIVQAILPLAGAAKDNIRWMAVAKPAAVTQFIFMCIAFSCLAYSFATNDFTVKYVAGHSNTYLPMVFKLSAVWGGHEGSLLLWALTLSGWTCAVALRSQQLPQIMLARVLGVLGLVAVGFHSFLIFTSNPFERLLPQFPVDGADLNPLLQDFGLIIHPPMLYMGYVGFSVVFAFAVAGLLGGRLDSAWARWSRPWTVASWCFLTVGIALGSWWAYYELGWGGWWFWDPVENASFMPWLSGTALIHSLAVTDKRGVFKSWTVLLAILTFSLSLLGTFLVRSGVLTSVHAFASDPERGFFILIFLFLVIGGSLLLFAIRAPKLQTESQYSGASREVLLLANNIVLVLATVIVLMGTLFPIFFDVLGLEKISVGAPYFNAMFAPVAVGLLFLMGIGPLINWKRHKIERLIRPFIIAFVSSVIIAMVSLNLLGMTLSLWVCLAVIVAVWVVWLTLMDFYRKMNTAKQGLWAGFNRLSRSYKGMIVAHMGIVITVVGVTIVATQDVEKDVRMRAGDSAVVGKYEFRFRGVQEIAGPNFTAQRGQVDIYVGEDLIAQLTPEKRRYWVQRNTMTEAAIDAGFSRDLYVALGEPLGDGSWAVRIYFKPFIRWVWGGGVIMAMGGVLAMSDRRYRLKVTSRLKMKSRLIRSELNTGTQA